MKITFVHIYMYCSTLQRIEQQVGTISCSLLWKWIKWINNNIQFKILKTHMSKGYILSKFPYKSLN